MFKMMGVFAELERAMIHERVSAALARGKAEDKTLGGPKIGPRRHASKGFTLHSLRHDNHPTSHRDPTIKINDILIDHADAARRGILSDG